MLAHLFRRKLHKQPSMVTIGTKGPFGLRPIKFCLDTFNSHEYIAGSIGTGKSKLIQSQLFQLATVGAGCGVLDPHSELANDLIAQLASYPKQKPWLYQPENRKRVIYVSPFKNNYLVPANVLKSSYATAHETAENVIEAFRRVWPETLSEAPRFAQIMRNALVVLIECNLSLVELEPLLTDKEYRKKLLAQTKTADAVSFFTNQYDRWGKDQLIMASPVLNKVSAFLFMPEIRAMIGANDNYLDFRKIIDEGKVLIIDIGGTTAHETQRLLGTLFMTSLEQAALSRENVKPHERTPFMFFIDEFGLFAAHDVSSFTRILSECRKYRLHLALAHQTITQLENERMKGALENAKLKILFGTGRQTAQAVMNQIFLPDPEMVKHEVKDEEAQERSHPLYESLYNQAEMAIQEVMRLKVRRTVVKLPESDNLFRLQTPTVPKARISWEQLGQIKQALSRQSGLPREELEREITAHRPEHTEYAPETQQGEDIDFWDEK